MLSSQLAILVERRAGTKGFNVRASLFVGPRLSVVSPQGVQGVPWRRRARPPASDPCGRTCRNFATCRTTSSTRCWTNGSMAGNPANASSVRSTRLSRQPATSKMMLVLVYSGCPRSCLMAHSDRGHPPPFPVPRTRCPGLP